LIHGESSTYLWEVSNLGGRNHDAHGQSPLAALPAWLAAGMSEAHAEPADLAGGEILLVGYGSGDAQLAPCHWQDRDRRRARQSD
jgi:hypothetical protein